MLALGFSCWAQDIVLNDFEASDFGTWTTTGTAFGSGPASGALSGQSSITGFMGGGLANSGNGGNSSTGTLTSPDFVIERNYINYLMCGGHWQDDIMVELMIGDSAARAWSGNHQYEMQWMTWIVSDLKGSTASIKITDNYTGEFGFICVDNVEQSDTRKYRNEALRPQFHFTPIANWMNDPSGMYYYDGEWHLQFQHNPQGRLADEANHDNTHWGHAVSTDLLNWIQMPNVLAPDALGLVFSGSAAVDWTNSSGFKSGSNDVILAFYTSRGAGNVQSLAYSNDRGRTYTRYSGNPVIPLSAENRDPMVFWYEPDSKWVIVLSEEGGFGFYTSTDAVNWTTLSQYGAGSWMWEDCPDIFTLPVDGNTSNIKWVLSDGGVGGYLIGQFDGTNFVPDNTEARKQDFGRAVTHQTFNDVPNDRRVQMAWIVIYSDYPNVPFNQQMTFPVELGLKTFPEGIRLTRQPVHEIALLHGTHHTWSNETLGSTNLLSGITGELFDIRAEFEIGTASEFGFRIHGQYSVGYNVDENGPTASGFPMEGLGSETIPPQNNRVKMQVLVDRATVEAFWDEGRASYANVHFTEGTAQPLEIYSNGGTTQLISMDVYELNSAWDLGVESGPVDVGKNTPAPEKGDVIKFAQGKLWISLAGEFSIIVRRLNGGTVFEAGSGRSSTYDVSHLQPGLYFVTVAAENYQYAKKVLVF
jgi:sucrose-6-phosphate hydrolase SacC (GH32 family)